MSTTGANIFLCGILVVDAYLQYLIDQKGKIIALYIYSLILLKQDRSKSRKKWKRL